MTFRPFSGVGCSQGPVQSVECGLVRQGMTGSASCRVMMSSCGTEHFYKQSMILFTRNYPLKTQFAWGTCSGPLHFLSLLWTLPLLSQISAPAGSRGDACACSQLDPGHYPDHISGKASLALHCCRMRSNQIMINCNVGWWFLVVKSSHSGIN